jgi:hypothetical protein
VAAGAASDIEAASLTVPIVAVAAVGIAYIVVADRTRSAAVARVVVGLIVEVVARMAVVEASSVPMVVDLGTVVVASWVVVIAEVAANLARMAAEAVVDLDHSTTWIAPSLFSHSRYINNDVLHCTTINAQNVTFCEKEGFYL